MIAWIVSAGVVAVAAGVLIAYWRDRLFARLFHVKHHRQKPDGLDTRYDME